ncbi:hypothetical protein MPER_01308, partial [Moniliophthora perniciosa FA553]
MPRTVILYRYDGSPFSEKVDHVLLLKSVPHQTVHVSSALPRPEITNLLGIGYRRIPILAIDNDIYYSTLFPLAPAHLPWEKFPKPFIDDRSSGIVASRGKSMGELSAQL